MTHESNRLRASRLPARLALCLLALAACASPPPPRATTDLDTRSRTVSWSPLTLGPNDVVRVEVHRRPEVSTPPDGVRIAADGTIRLPLIGAVNLMGRTVGEATDLLEEALAVYFRHPSAIVSVVEHGSKRFYVTGQVRAPGPKVMDRPLTLLEGLSYGGEVLSGADRADVVVLRRHGEEVEVIPFDTLTPGADALVQLLPDDVIFVPLSRTGRFSEDVLPVLQGVGFTASQLTTLDVLVFD
ncbi:MAG: polysaccharide biosynthesis/export family protein [Planctomycetota bacterium]|jgi:polysaccharide export outer membrane protein|nr:polysaccharide biosynthesis/export family protein [Planctomycetota bacterium]